MKNLKYEAFMRIEIPKMESPFSCDSSKQKLFRALEVFHANLTRMISLALYPVTAMTLAAIYQDAFTSVIFKVTGKHNLRTRERHSLSRQEQAEIEAEFDHVFKCKLRELDEDIKSGVDWSLLRGIALVSYDDTARIAVQSMYASALVDTWTAFEIFARDLLAICQTQPVWASLAKAKKKPFLNRKETKSSYIEIFPGFEKELNGIFESNEIKWIGAIRNLLVHDAGIVHDRFCSLMTGHKTLGSLQSGSVLELDGEEVIELVKATIASGFELHRFVDKQICRSIIA